MNNLITLPEIIILFIPKTILYTLSDGSSSDTLNYNHIAFDWILDGWDFVNTQSSPQGFIYRLIKPQLPVINTLKNIISEKYMVNLLTESKNKDS